MTRLVIATALMSEAVPLVDFYRMKKMPRQAGFRLFRADRIDLLVCGVGAQQMSQSLTAYLAFHGSDEHVRWLNFGIAGAADYSLGALIWANQVAQITIGLPTGITHQLPVTVQSMGQPSTDYLPQVLFDMEAEAWLGCLAENLHQFSPQQLFCAKVISDNSARHSHTIDKQWVSGLIRERIKALALAIDGLLR